jgi:hypothetical protein
MVRLAKQVQISMKMENTLTYFFVDSMVALHWIRGCPSKWTTYVANRVSEIQTSFPNAKWDHVASKQNPADLASRSCSAKELIDNTLWWTGPIWLRENETSWPTHASFNMENIPEQRATNVFVAIQGDEWDIFNRFSSYNKLIRVTSLILRFSFNCRNSKNKRTGILSALELKQAHDILIKITQSQCFHHEKIQLQNDKYVSNNSKLKSLNPFIMNDIIHVGGRLTNADIPFNERHPILLPTKHNFTNLLIKNYHYKYLHMGAQTLLTQIRQRYWPIDGKNTIKRVIRKCILCFRYKAPTMNQIMASLPEDRLTQTRPFALCGTDYTGHIEIKSGLTRNSKVTKAYICLFICFSTKAIHLELVTSLCIESFLNCLRRFISRRGRPIRIYSDNSTTYQGSSNTLNDFYKMINNNSNQLSDFCANEWIDWRFIPPRSPHWGGLWESGIKSVKKHLRLSLHGVVPTYEQIFTILPQIEAMVNSRPLTPLSSDPTDLTSLTPSHFLIGSNINSFPDPDAIIKLPETPMKHYNMMLSIFRSFWSRWHKEYFQSLQQRVKWTKPNINIQINDLVLIKEDSVSPLQWPLGRIIETYPGRDGRTRVVLVRTHKGTYKRSITRIAILPLEDTKNQ